MLFNDLYSIVLMVVQILALAWACMVVGKLVFGFGLDAEGQVVTANKRGKFVSNMADHAREFIRKARGKTHDAKKVKVVMGKVEEPVNQD